MDDPTRCPSCGKPRREGDVECPYCGIVYARFRPRPPATDPRAPPGRPTRPPAPSARPGRGPAQRPPPPDAETEKRARLQARSDRVEVILGLAQWMDGARDPRTFWQGALVGGLGRAVQNRITAVASTNADPLVVLAGAGFMSARSLALARLGEQHGRLAETLRLLALAERHQRALRNDWFLFLGLPLIGAGLTVLSVELPMVLAGWGGALSGPAVLIMAAGGLVLAAAGGRSSESALDRTVRQVLAWTPGWGFGFRWKAQWALLDVLERAPPLPFELIVGIAAFAADHPVAARLAESAKSTDAPTTSFAPWFSARDRAVLMHGTEVDALAELLGDLKEQRQRGAAIIHRVTAWGLLILASAGTTVLATVRVAQMWLEYAKNLGVP